MIEMKYADYAWEQTEALLAIDSPSGYTRKAAEWVKEAFEKLGFHAEITVKGGVPTVEACEDTPDLSLSLCDAEVFFFRNLAPDRAKVDPRAASWLPLPLFIHEPDNV